MNNPQKEKHIQLAGVIKGVHAKLRKQFKQSGDYDHVWREHCQDNNSLHEYADAMHTLATQIWTKHPETRIDWCRKICKEYFFDGGLKKVLEKELRKKSFQRKIARDDCTSSCPERVQDHDRSKTEEMQDEVTSQVMSPCLNQVQDHPKIISPRRSSLDKPSSKVCNYDVMDNCTGPCEICVSNSDSTRTVCTHTDVYSVINAAKCDPECMCTATHHLHSQSLVSTCMCNKERQFNFITLPCDGRIRLLDVGSCYNAFQDLEEFQAVGIDISPAVKSVYHCDFLHLDIIEPLQLSEDMEAFLYKLNSPIDSLPSELFHVVVFSLLLEYFPSTHQRWICCQKAHKLLAINGILIIITPDSHHQNRNAPMMKSWRTAIESIGFIRWRYVKLEHLHCLVFRKVSREGPVSLTEDIKPDMLYIPQDMNDYDDTVNSFVPQTQEDLFTLKSNFDELPNINDSDSN